MIVYLIGYMGCGKSTAGKGLAKKLGYEFIDLDELLEANEGRTISEIFANDGEEAFRKIEQATLASTFGLEHVIIATGGGAPCFFDNMAQMNAHGLTIYIQMTPEGLMERLQGGMDHRPILKGKSPQELHRFIAEALEKRNPFYTQAKSIVDGQILSPELLHNAIELHQKYQ